MSDKPTYRRVATVYVREDKKKSGKKKTAAQGHGKVYNALDKLERIARVLSEINKAVMGDPDPKSKKNKKRRKQIKKYARIDKKTGVLILKKAKKVKKPKKAKLAKRSVK